MLGAQNLLQLRGRFHPIFEWQHPGYGRQKRSHRTRGFGDLPGLDRENDGVHRAEFFWLVTGILDLSREIALGAQDPQAVPADGLKMWPASLYRNRVASPGQNCREVPANAANANNRECILVHGRPSTIADSRSCAIC